MLLARDGAICFPQLPSHFPDGILSADPFGLTTGKGLTARREYLYRSDGCCEGPPHRACLGAG